jgi:polyhydroxyalkanoate synthesis regulator protein
VDAEGAHNGVMARMVKRYGRSRLYDTQAARYVTLADLHLKAWASEGIPFTVIDAETGDVITRVLLAYLPPQCRHFGALPKVQSAFAALAH